MSEYRPRIYIRDYADVDYRLLGLSKRLELEGQSARLLRSLILRTPERDFGDAELLEGDAAPGSLLYEGDVTGAVMLESTSIYLITGATAQFKFSRRILLEGDAQIGGSDGVLLEGDAQTSGFDAELTQEITMAVSAFFRFNIYSQDIHHGVHDFSADTIKLVLCNAANAPVATDAVLADLTPVDMTNLDDDVVTITSSGETSGIYKLVLQDKILLASGGDLPAWRYVAFYNDSSPSKSLIFHYDYGSDLQMDEDEQIRIDMSESSGVLQLG